MGVLARLVARAAASVGTVLAVVSVVFLAFRLLPGDPAALILGEQSSDIERAALRGRLGLDEPLVTQYARFVGRMSHGRFGPSLRWPQSDAIDIVWRAFPSTALLAGIAVTLGTVLGVSLALVTVGARRSWARAAANRMLALSSSVPLLGFAPAMTWLFTVRWRVAPLPADPEAGARGVVFAAALLAIPLGAAVGRVARTGLDTAARSPFLQVARAKGRGEAAVWAIHALPTCIGPIVTVIAAQLGALLGGAIVLERLLERRGLGTVLAEALAARDLTVIEATVGLSALLFVCAQAVGGALHRRLDPRAR